MTWAQQNGEHHRIVSHVLQCLADDLKISDFNEYDLRCDRRKGRDTHTLRPPSSYQMFLAINMTLTTISQVAEPPS
jgi:hypothetical protein